MNFKEFYLLERQQISKPNIIDYVGKFGIDKKIVSFEKELSKVTIFEVTDKKIVYGTDKKRIVDYIEQGEDKKEQIEGEIIFYNRQIKEYNSQLQYYYDKIYEMDFINKVDEFRKYLNNIMKSLVSTYILLKELTK
jgi:hypothetical protein